MGKGTPGLRQALKAITSFQSGLNAETDADYAVALSALTAGRKNISKQTRALSRDLLSGQTKSVASLNKLAKTARAQKGVVAGQEDATVSRYGTALGASVHSQYGVARAAAAGTGKLLTGTAKAGKATAKTAGTIIQLAKTGNRAQQAAAKYALAQAMQQRNIATNESVAAMMSQVYTQAIAFENQKALLEYQYELEQKKIAAEEAKSYPGLQVVVDSAADTAQSLRDYFNDPVKYGLTAESTPGAIADAYIEANGIIDSAEAILVKTLASNMYRAGAGPTAEGAIDWTGGQGQSIVEQSITASIGRLYPNFTPVLPQLEAYTAARTNYNGMLASTPEQGSPTLPHWLHVVLFPGKTIFGKSDKELYE